MDTQPEKFYIIDHAEGALSEWVKAEYIQISEYMKSSKHKSIITNTKTFTDKETSDNNTEQLIKDFNNELIANPGKVELLEGQFKEYIHSENENQFVLVDNKKIPINKVCLLDMKAPSELKPEDYNEFDIFLLGGILGDHPSKDRTSYLRVEGYKSRHLGELQMTTDTALLCTKLVVENKIELKDIPCVDEPEFVKDGTDGSEAVCMEGFRYITDNLDYTDGTVKPKENAKPLGNKKIYEDIIFEEFDFTKLL
jgi:ribosome biogenesis SPOUT family RNA methylase Rps3